MLKRGKEINGWCKMKILELLMMFKRAKRVTNLHKQKALELSMMPQKIKKTNKKNLTLLMMNQKLHLNKINLKISIKIMTLVISEHSKKR